jgi:YHS domain-containing protein
MKHLKHIIGALVLGGILASSTAALAADSSTPAQAKSARPYTLKTCIVSGEKLGEMGKPYVFVHEGQEIKLCCKNCLKDFQKDPAKYVKKLAAAGDAKAPQAPAHSH